jgi:hypothetical protein
MEIIQDGPRLDYGNHELLLSGQMKGRRHGATEQEARRVHRQKRSLVSCAAFTQLKIDVLWILTSYMALQAKVTPEGCTPKQ